jgi:rhodanese-related sulfurtransferase
MCHSGMRSARVCQYLETQDYNVKNLNGGIDSWSVNIDPTVPRY